MERALDPSGGRIEARAVLSQLLVRSEHANPLRFGGDRHELPRQLVPAGPGEAGDAVAGRAFRHLVLLAFGGPDGNNLRFREKATDSLNEFRGRVSGKNRSGSRGTVIGGPPAEDVSAPARGWSCLQIVEEDSAWLRKLREQRADSLHVGVEGFFVEDRHP